MSGASGIGSWPGRDPRTAVRVVRDILAVEAEGLTGVPYLPELPDRGPGAELAGRGAGLLVEMPVDLQPSGWRVVDRPGQDAARTAAWLREDLDELAEAYAGYAGPLKLAVAGPWTLAAQVRTARGERLVGDLGACTDLAQSLAEGVRAHVAQVARLVPGAGIAVQLDEPSLPAVLAGRLPTSSGYGTHRALDPELVERGLATVVTAAGEGGRTVVVHCCAPHPPLALLRAAGASAVSLDTTLLTPRGWESLAAAVESGVGLWAGIDVGPRPSVADSAAPLLRAWSDVGLAPAQLAGVTVTPACGLAGHSPDDARARQATAREVTRALAEHAAA